jgi:hypothetical protein
LSLFSFQPFSFRQTPRTDVVDLQKRGAHSRSWEEIQSGNSRTLNRDRYKLRTYLRTESVKSLDNRIPQD